MNTQYQQLFNMPYINSIQEYHAKQNMEIAKAVKAMHDFCDAARKISPEYQEIANRAYAAAILEEISKG